MSFEIYPADFSTRYELTHAISVQMSLYYNDIGKLSIVAPVSDYNIKMLKVGNVLYDTERGSTYIIVNTKHDTEANRISANGFSASWLLNTRCIALSSTLNNIETGVYEIIEANLRGLPRLNTATVSGLTESTDAILYGGQILDEIMPYLEQAQLGHTMLWDPEVLAWTFKIYKGQDLTNGIHAVVFSDEQGTAQALTINDDDSTLKNIAYVQGELSTGEVFVETVGDTSAAVRREVWLRSSIRQEDAETVSACKDRARAYGFMELGKRLHRKSFTVEIDGAEFGRTYKLGDVVSCVSLRFGVSFKARISGVKYTMDNTSVNTEIILGEPILTALGALKING